jgi:hypothetical protein
MMKKINLKEFQASKLTLSERLNVKGGSGVTTSSRRGTSCTGTDHDFKKVDTD